MLRRWLSHPLTRGLDLDDPRTTRLRRRLLTEKRFLRRVYEDWYASVAAALPSGEGPVLELGAGAGFLDRYVPELLTSEVLPVEHVSLILDGTALPFAGGSLRAVVMTNVFHHLGDAARFLREAGRAVRPGGALVMIEPWRTPFSELIYRRLHHEPFEPGVSDWRLPPGGPLSGANGALPWIVFERDRERFDQEFQEWRLEAVEPLMPLRYLVSGGLAWRSLMPSWSYGLWRRLDEWLVRSTSAALFARIVVRRAPP